MTRNAIIALGALLLTSCGYDDSLSTAATVDARGAAENGFVLIGLGIAPGSDAGGRNRIAIQAVRADSKLGRPLKYIDVCGSDVVLLPDPSGSRCLPGQVLYHIVPVPPGRYIALSFSNSKSFPNRIAVTDLIDPEPGLRIGGRITGPGSSIAHPERSFVVEAGKVTYVGDALFDPRVLPVGIGFRRSDAAARAALAAYPTIGHLPVVYQPLLGPSPS